jgi:DNA-binding MarR family transcriptional regulator
MEDMQETLVALFTEVAILEQLVRVREERHALHNLSMGEFGLLNYFMLNHPAAESIASMAFVFQEDEDHTRAKVDALAARGLITVAPAPNPSDAMVMITDKGRDARNEVIEKMAPVIKMAVAEIPAHDIVATLKTLREIRLTLDNLPDR